MKHAENAKHIRAVLKKSANRKKHRVNGHTVTVSRAVRSRMKSFQAGPDAVKPPRRVTIAYTTTKGKMLQGTIEKALDHAAVTAVKGKVNLILTSPPFPLVRKKRYGN